MNEISKQPTLYLKAKIPSFAWETIYIGPFALGVFFLIFSLILIITGVFYYDVDLVIASVFSFIIGMILFTLFFPYRSGKIVCYEDRIVFPKKGFGFFRGKYIQIRYGKINNIHVSFKFPRTDRIKSIFFDSPHYKSLELFGNGHAKLLRILRLLEESGVKILPRNWNSRRTITWKDRYVLISYVYIPFLFVIAITLPIIVTVFLGVNVTYFMSLSIVVGLVAVMLFLALYSKIRLSIEDKYVEKGNPPDRS